MDGLSKYVHIAFSDSAAGTLKHFFSENESSYKGEVMSVSEDFSVGPLSDIDTREGLRDRLEWFKKMLLDTGLEDEVLYFENAIIKSHMILKDIGEDKDIVLWCGMNTSEQIGIRYAVSKLIKNRIHIADVTNRGLRRCGCIPRSTGECDAGQIGHAMKNIYEMTQEQKSSYEEDFQTITDSSGTLRILEDGGILEVGEDYYDEDIIANCTFNFKRAARVIGSTMGRSDQYVGDTYIYYRMKRLIGEGRIIARGDMSSMRTFDVRVKGDLRGFFEKVFEKSVEKDEDHFYHYLLEDKEGKLVVENTDINDWNMVGISNKLIIDFDDENMFSLTWLKDGMDIVSVNHTRVDNIDYRTVEIEMPDSSESIKEEMIDIELENMSDRYLEIQTRPYLSIRIKQKEM